MVGSAAAVAVSNLLMPMWLCSAGFCATGVQAGSLAAWWQSTLPLIASGSLFATLQSIAMGGTVIVSTSSAAALGAALGTAGGTSVALGDFCRMVDELEPGTGTAVAVQANLELYRGLSSATNAAAPYVKKVTKVANEYISDTWNWFSDIVEEAHKEAKRKKAKKEQEDRRSADAAR